MIQKDVQGDDRDKDFDMMEEGDINIDSNIAGGVNLE